jgi:hypothetical protein
MYAFAPIYATSHRGTSLCPVGYGDVSSLGPCFVLGFGLIPTAELPDPGLQDILLYCFYINWASPSDLDSGRAFFTQSLLPQLTAAAGTYAYACLYWASHLLAVLHSLLGQRCRRRGTWWHLHYLSRLFLFHITN